MTIGQVWKVFALGEEITDPDTGVKLGRNETEIGTIKIVRTTATLSYSEATEDKGIATGNIVRPEQIDAQPTSVPSSSPPKDKSISDKIKDDI